MFSIQNKHEGGFSKLVLLDDSTGTQVDIAPSCGAILTGFKVKNDGQETNVIDSYDDEDDFRKNVTSKGFLGCKLSPFVCRLKNGRFHFAANDYQVEKFFLGNHAIHGLIYDQAFELTNLDSNEHMATVSMSCTYDELDKGYPFRYNCMVTYTLSAGNKLAITTRIMNTSVGLIPIADGWHPYFSLGGSINDLQLEFQSKEFVEFDEELLPTGKLTRYEDYGSLREIGDAVFDNCFSLDFTECQPMCVLRNPVKNIQVEIHPENSYPYLQVYTPSHRKSIAIENLSSVPDAFNNGIGLRTLEPNEWASFTTTYIISSKITHE